MASSLATARTYCTEHGTTCQLACVTIWQSGFVSGIPHPDPNAPASLPGIFTWTTNLEAWSPDGRYLLYAIAPSALVELPGTSPPTEDELNAYGLNGSGLLPLRDVALLRVLRTVNPDDPAGTAVSWRRDGRVRATYAPEGRLVPHPLLIYDCASGRQLASLLPPGADGSVAMPGASILLRWSPDGSHLLLFALEVGQVVVWGPQQLPRQGRLP